MDRRTDLQLNQILSAKAKQAKVNGICLKIVEKLEKVHQWLNFGFTAEAEGMLDSCEKDLNEAKSLGTFTAKLTSTQARYNKATDIFDRVSKLCGLTDEELEKLIADNIDNEFTGMKPATNILAQRICKREIERCKVFVEDRDINSAYLCIRTCRSELGKMGGCGRKAAVTPLEDAVSAFEQKLEELDGVNIETRNIRYKVARRMEKKLFDTTEEDKDDTTVEDKDDKRISDFQRTTLLSVIEKLEKMAQAYEAGDMDTCETELEIALLIFDDIRIVDAKTVYIKKQLDNWHRLINTDK